MQRKYMTKAQALASFHTEIGLVDGDTPANRENWNNYVWHLYKNRYVSMHQYNTWANPF